MATPLGDVLGESEAPEDWTKANIAPILKKDSKMKALNHRPVSLASRPCKVLEKLTKKSTKEQLENKPILCCHQPGFQCGRSCLTRLVECFQELEDAVEEKDDVDVICVDCSKALDTVPHQRLVSKMKAVAIEGEIWRWVQACLGNSKHTRA